MRPWKSTCGILLGLFLTLVAMVPPDRQHSIAEPPKGPTIELSVKEIFFRKIPDVGWVARFSHVSDVGAPRQLGGDKAVYAFSVADDNPFGSGSQNAEVEVLASPDASRLYRVTVTFGLIRHADIYLLPDDVTSYHALLTKLVGAIRPDCDELSQDAYLNFARSPFRDGETRATSVCGLKLGLSVTSGIADSSLAVVLEP